MKTRALDKIQSKVISRHPQLITPIMKIQEEVKGQMKTMTNKKMETKKTKK